MKSTLVLVIVSIIASSAAFKIQSRISDGKVADIRNHPWLVSLRERNEHVCGAALITLDRAVTAAHCYDIDIAAREYSVYAGTARRTSDGELAPVGRIYVHLDYDEETSVNDIAVVWLLKRLTGHLIRPIALPRKNDMLPNNANVVVAGWGVQSARGGYSEQLYEATLPFVRDSQCAATYKHRIDISTAFCAGHVNGGADTTPGDSGGPLVYNSKVYGIVSWGSASNNLAQVGVYTRVSAFIDWINLAITDDYFRPRPK